MVKAISILGSTGSIGRQTAQAAGRLGIPVLALAARRDVDRLEEQARQFRPKYISVTDSAAAKELRARLSDTDIEIGEGEESLVAAATVEGADCVVTGISGSVGLRLIQPEIRHDIAEILPVDSEHSAIFQSMAGRDKSELRRILLTGSGGPFRGWTREQTRDVTPERAVRHPNWSMGAKISIDSATMMNKGLEFIEAMHLFAVTPDQIKVIIHPESAIHSMVELLDGTVIAQLGVPDMRIPIQYALTYPRRFPSPVKQLNLADWQKLTFYAPDEETFTCFGACKRAIRRGGTLPAAVNGANEAAVALFLKEKIGWQDIGELVCHVADTFETAPVTSVEDVLEADRKARAYVLERCGESAR